MSSPVSTQRNLARSALVIGALTSVSRVLGFVRDVLLALAFGTGIAAEAFVVSFKLPNLFRDMVGEGAMNAAIVPVLAESRSKSGDPDFLKLAAALLNWLTALLFVIAVLGVVFAPLVVTAAAPGFHGDPEKFTLTVSLTRSLFPFIFFVGLSALLMGILNAMGRFASSAAGPALLNCSMIVSLAWLVPGRGVKALAVGVLVGGILQCGLQMIALKNALRGAGWQQVIAQGRIRFFGNFERHPGLWRILKLLGPRLWGSAVYQVSVFVDTILASFYWIVGAGGQSALYYASRLFQLPLAVFGVSLAQAALPALSDHHARGEENEYRAALFFSLRNMVYATLPAAVGLAVFSGSIVRLLFERGNFTAYSTAVTSGALSCYAWGLASCGAVKILANAFYARHDTKTPVMLASLSLVVNVVLNLLLMAPLKISGLALATSVSATLNAVLLYVLLARKAGIREHRPFFDSAARSAAAAAVMGAAGLFFLDPWVRSAVAAGAAGHAALRLFAAIAASVAIYWLAGLVFRSEEARHLRRVFTKPS